MKKEKSILQIYVIPQQHWDPFWSFGPEISERMGVNNIRKALDIIRENPNFRYVIGQVYLWDLFKKHFPDRVEEVKQRVREGKIELGGGGYVNPDLNLPSGESLIRQFLYGKKVFREEFGVDPVCVWCMDSFGQSGQLPQIFFKLGFKYHTAKRGASKDLPAVFVWQGVDGSKIIFDRQPLGHHGIAVFPAFSLTPSRERPNEKLEKLAKPIAFPLALIALYSPAEFFVWLANKGRVNSFHQALKFLAERYPNGKIFLPHGFSADGAMPFNWISYLSEVYSRLSGDKMIISLPSEFFKAIEKENLQIVKGELNGPTEKLGEAWGALPATASTRIEIKQTNRQIEKLLYVAELLESFKFLSTGKCDDLSALWRDKFLTDFHDNICGSLTDENYKLLRRKAISLKLHCQKIIRENLKLLAPGKSVFNPLPWPRKDLVRIDNELKLVQAEPIGFSPIKVSEMDKGFDFDKRTLTTPFYKVSWENGELKIYQDERQITGKNFGRIRIQKEDGDAYFWNVSKEYWNRIESIQLIEIGKRAILEIKSFWQNTTITQRIYFYLHTPRIDFRVKINNREKDIRLQTCLSFETDLSAVALAEAENSEIIREIPAGFVRDGDGDGQMSWKKLFGEKFAYYDDIKCVQNWLYLGSKEKGVAIFNDGLPEHEIIKKGGCYLTLLRCVGRLATRGQGLRKFRPENVPWSAGGTTAIPLAQEQGRYEFRYAVQPIEKENVVRAAYEFLFPLMVIEGADRTKPVTLFSISDKNVIPLTVKQAENGKALVIRLLETEGKDKEIEIKFNPDFHFKSAATANLMEEEIDQLNFENGLPSEALAKEGILNLRIKAQEIVTLILKPC